MTLFTLPQLLSPGSGRDRWFRGAALLGLAAALSVGTIACGGAPTEETAATSEETAQVEGSKANNKAGAERFRGLWEPQVEGDGSPSLFFSEDGRAFFVSPNPEDNQAIEMEYALNVDATPMHLDIILPGENATLKGIVELTGADQMRLDGAEALEDPRPEEFSDDAVTFKRVSKDPQLPEDMDVLTREQIRAIQEGGAPPAPSAPAE